MGDSANMVVGRVVGARWLTRLGWAAAATVSLTLLSAALPLELARLGREAVDYQASMALIDISPSLYMLYLSVPLVLSALLYPLLGAILIWRRPVDRQAILAALMLATLAFQVAGVGGALADAQPVWRLPVQLNQSIFAISSFLFYISLPGGRLSSAGQRWLAWSWIAIYSAAALLPATPFNPHRWPSGALALWYAVWYGVGLIPLLSTYPSLPPTARQQIKWVLFGGAIAVFVQLIVALTPWLFPALAASTLRGLIFDWVAQPLRFLGTAFVPLSLAFAILRHRLWQIDLLIRQTALYALLLGVLALVYIGSVTALQPVLRPLFGSSTLAVVLSTLALVGLFQPLRRRARLLIDRSFYRERYNSGAALGEFSARARTAVDALAVADSLLRTLQSTVRPTTAAVWMHGAAGALEQIAVASATTRTAPAWPRQIVAGDALLDRIGIQAAPLDLDDDLRELPQTELLAALRSDNAALVLPLVSQARLAGLLQLGPRLSGEPYRSADLELLAQLTAQAAPALRVAQLVRQQQDEALNRERIRQELRLARLVQTSFLPTQLPDLPGLHLTAHYQPAREVGGDFYDVIGLADGRLLVVIGDVTGKGVPAALLMARTQSFLRATAQDTSAPGAVLARVNRLLRADMPKGMFVTCAALSIDLHTGAVALASAGHLTPYLRSGADVWALSVLGLPLGAAAETIYPELTTTLVPGATLLLYSDGLVEAHSPSGEIFGFERLERVLADADAPRLETLVSALQAFAGAGREPEDDITLLMVRRSDAAYT